MIKNKIGLIVAAAAAYGVYKYFTMTPDQRESLKTKGRDFLDKNASDLGNLFGRKVNTANGSN